MVRMGAITDGIETRYLYEFQQKYLDSDPSSIHATYVIHGTKEAKSSAEDLPSTNDTILLSEENEGISTQVTVYDDKEIKTFALVEQERLEGML
jgi:hypothetical protein